MTVRGKAYVWALAVWLIFLIAALLIGAVREGFLTPAIGQHAAHIVGTLTFVVIMLAIIYLFVDRMKVRLKHADFWRIGVIWSAMTMAFEFGFFHFVAGKPWDVLLADYNIFAGHIWVLVLATTLFGPPTIRALLQRRLG